MSKTLVEFIVPEKKLCVDNAIMIAWAGIEKLKNKKISDSHDKNQNLMEFRGFR